MEDQCDICGDEVDIDGFRRQIINTGLLVLFTIGVWFAVIKITL